MNHKRGRPKSKRAGCLLCKPHKHEAHVKLPRSPAALAVVTERPPVSTPSWFADYERFGALVVDTSDDMIDDDWYDEEDDTSTIEATPLRVTLAEVAA